MAYTQSMDLPMLAYTSRISKVVNLLFGLVLFAAIYSAATSTYFGFSTKIKESPKKKYIIIIGACIGFICGLTGFKTIVAYLYPVEGYIGFAIILMIAANFFRVYKNNAMEKEMKHDSEAFQNFDSYDRFAYPDDIVRVTAGFGGEALLVFGSEKQRSTTAVWHIVMTSFSKISLLHCRQEAERDWIMCCCLTRTTIISVRCHISQRDGLRLLSVLQPRQSLSLKVKGQRDNETLRRSGER